MYTGCSLQWHRPLATAVSHSNTDVRGCHARCHPVHQKNLGFSVLFKDTLTCKIYRCGTKGITHVRVEFHFVGSFFAHQSNNRQTDVCLVCHVRLSMLENVCRCLVRFEIFTPTGEGCPCQVIEL